MPVKKGKKTVVKKISFEEEERLKDEEFLKLTLLERLKIHEQLRKRIWGEKYNKVKLKGLKVTKKAMS